MSKRAEEAAWDWAVKNKLDPYSMGQAYGQGYKHAIERACEWMKEIDNGTQITDVDAFVAAFKKYMEE